MITTTNLSVKPDQVQRGSRWMRVVGAMLITALSVVGASVAASAHAGAAPPPYVQC